MDVPNACLAKGRDDASGFLVQNFDVRNRGAKICYCGSYTGTMMHPSRSGSGLPDSEARVANSVVERISDSKVSKMSNLERDTTAKRIHDESVSLSCRT